MNAYPTTTTLNIIRSASPCKDGWKKLLAHLGKTEADDEPLSIMTIVESNGLDDALWCIDADPELDRLRRHFQAWCAEQVLHVFETAMPNDSRMRDQIAMLRRDDATDFERAAAQVAAWTAAWTVAWDAAWDAARAAARAAARDAAWAAVRAAAEAAARDAQEQQLRFMLTEKTQ